MLFRSAPQLAGGVSACDTIPRALSSVAPPARRRQSPRRACRCRRYVRKGKGVRIKGGTGAAYYVGVESAMPAAPGFEAPIEALCIAPFGMEEGTEADLPPYEFGVVVGEPVHFRFFSSNVRRDDAVGSRLDWWPEGEIEELEEIEVTLSAEKHRPGEVVPVQLAARVTEVGTLQLEAVAKDSGERWKVEFDVRASSQPAPTEDPDAAPEEPILGVEPEAFASSEGETQAQEGEAQPEDSGHDQDSDKGKGKKSFWSSFK